MRGLFSKPVAGSIRPWRRQSGWTPTRGLGIRLDTVKPKRTIGILIRNGLILILLAAWLDLKVQDIWESGFKAGYGVGLQQGLTQPPTMWKSGGNTGKIMESRQPGQDAPSTT